MRGPKPATTVLQVRMTSPTPHTDTYHIVENEAGVGEFEVFEKAVEFAAVQGTPGTVEIISCLGLLPSVVVVQELSEIT